VEQVTPVALAIALRAGQVLVGRRTGDPLFPDHWEFPGGKILPGEPPGDAAVRELEEETGLFCIDPQPLAVFDYDYPGRSLRLHCFVLNCLEGEPVQDDARRWTWTTVPELSRLSMPEANQRILEALASWSTHE
jgi:mutator protein MutT